MSAENLEYAGFWVRVGASLIDTVLVVLATVPLLMLLYGRADFTGAGPGSVSGFTDFIVSWLLPAVIVIVFWLTRQATPGKMVFSARVVDARTGGTLTLGQSIGRYLGYFVSTIPFGLGLIWVAFDPKKQGWHDKLAGTVVVRTRHRATEPVRFEQAD
jgi:uncharacterized RDD family membrane protein YckC